MIGINIDEMTSISLAMGGTTTIYKLRYVSTADGDLFALGQDKKLEEQERPLALRQFIDRIKTATKHRISGFTL
jgi:hypothetical protein